MAADPRLAVILEDAKHDPKQRMKVLNTIIPKKNTQRISPTTLIYEDRTYTDPQDIANALNDHYITTGQKTTTSIPTNGIEDDYIENNDHNQHADIPTFTLRHTTEETVTRTMKAINRNKASDIYKIKP